MKSKDSMEVKNKMEGGDTMENNVGKFTQEQIDELLQKAKANNGKGQILAQEPQEVHLGKWIARTFSTAILSGL